MGRQGSWLGYMARKLGSGGGVANIYWALTVCDTYHTVYLIRSSQLPKRTKKPILQLRKINPERHYISSEDILQMGLIILFYRWVHWLRRENICPRDLTTVSGRTKTWKLSKLGMKASALLQMLDDIDTPHTSKAALLSVNKAGALSTKALFIWFIWLFLVFLGGFFFFLVFCPLMGSPLPHSPMVYSQKWWLLSQRRGTSPAPGMLSRGALHLEESELFTATGSSQRD